MAALIPGLVTIVVAATAAVLVAIVPSYLPDSLIGYQPIAFGAAALIVAATFDRTFGLGRRSAGRAERSPARSRLAAAVAS